MSKQRHSKDRGSHYPRTAVLNLDGNDSYTPEDGRNVSYDKIREQNRFNCDVSERKEPEKLETLS